MTVNSFLPILAQFQTWTLLQTISGRRKACDENSCAAVFCSSPSQLLTPRMKAPGPKADRDPMRYGLPVDGRERVPITAIIETTS